MIALTFLDLPNDIIYHILAQLLSDAEDHIALMKRAATVRRAHRIFDNITCPHLFKTVYIKRLERLHEFQSILESNGKLALYVRSLILNPMAHYDDRPREHRTVNGTVLSFLQNDSLPVILPQLVRLQNFAYAPHFRGSAISWARLSLPMSRALQNLSRLPYLNHLHLENIYGAPIVWISQCKNLEKLTLSEFSWDPNISIVHASAQSKRPRIKDLEIDDPPRCPCDAAIRTFHAMGMFSALQRLSIFLAGENNIKLLLFLLKDCTETLTELVITQNSTRLTKPADGVPLGSIDG
ncbi:hypothetical protein CVT24_007169 [Panaeolus cyanescens]|uniref:F-box domain-containing protein n=1 Tax=Panaeolus cyanescens TaxID=181874 RepID=A0A409YPK4_9AGAR|nr:hypothetical protein CVT24_007169 [Panaeolus cyanescens]